MHITPELVAYVVAGIAGVWLAVVGLAKWVGRKITALEKERARAEADLRAQHQRDQDRCARENASLVSRVISLEERAHQENREDRAAMLKILDTSAKAVAAFAERMPPSDPTPPQGTKR